MKKLLKRILCIWNDEDEGYQDHLVGQKQAPFYCGTPFCGHSTKRAARECWKRKCDAVNSIRAEVEALRNAGRMREAAIVELRAEVYYPERNPANWPINRSLIDLQRDYIERAKEEQRGITEAR